MQTTLRAGLTVGGRSTRSAPARATPARVALPNAHAPARRAALASPPSSSGPASRGSTRGSIRVSAASADDEIVKDQSFRIERISFGSILTPLGIGLLVYGFGAFIGALPGADLSSVILIYGFPIALLGAALSYAQLEPVPCTTTAGAARVRETAATDIQKQLREDVTRFRYGDEQHLEEALARIFAFGRQGGVPRRLAPLLVGVREELTGPEKAYTLVLEFSCKPDLGPDAWESRLAKIEGFFGPGIKASLTPTAIGMDVELAVDGSGAGRGGEVQKDVLMPLVPGAPARRQD